MEDIVTNWMFPSTALIGEYLSSYPFWMILSTTLIMIWMITTSIMGSNQNKDDRRVTDYMNANNSTTTNKANEDGKTTNASISERDVIRECQTNIKVYQRERHSSGEVFATDDEDDMEDLGQNEKDEAEEIFYKKPPKQITVRNERDCRDTDVHVYNDISDCETVVIFHGFGGRKEEFQEGRMCQRLATQYRVIAFDWYGHGKSSKSNQYRKEAFLEQANTVVSKFLKPHQTFHLYCFSMGNFLGLNFVRRYPNRVERMVLHSPWNAELSAMGGWKTIDYSIRIPGLGLALCETVRRTVLKHVHDAKTYKQILMDLPEGKAKWHALLDDLSLPECTSPKQILIICGKRGEYPFYLLAKDAHRRLNRLRGETKNNNGVGNGKSILHVWKNAGHMTWAEKWDQPVGSFFRNHVMDFLSSSSS
mmetsp:Transcript_12392/g.19061  ORF Transcript_12392/g.19061 Transcript_12392/m.19061 type:complete len:420 (-) Transcript_12392:51-1310(-)